MIDNVLVVGAGVSGLAFAREILKEGATDVRIVEKSRGVGGRCASRRVDGQPIDHGVPLLHGESGRFRAELQHLQTRATVIADWPWRVRGDGVPCQPQAYRVQAMRIAVVEGVNQLPKQLAEGLAIQRECRVEALSYEGDKLLVHTSTGAQTCRTLVLTAPADQTRALIEPLARFEPIRSVVGLLSGVYTVPSWTVLAGFDRRDGEDWHLQLPGPESIVHTIIHDSSKRPGPWTTLVIQARASYSRQRLESDPAACTEDLIDAAGRLLGAWVRSPRWVQAHRWRFARVQRGHELAHPIVVTLPGGARIAFCGEAFHPLGGVEGAFLSGIALARRLVSLSV